MSSRLRRWLLFTILLCCGIYSQAQLAANFTANPKTGCAPLVVFFSDSSTGNPTSWKWDLGNGTISFLQNPAVTYFTPGTYNIKLVIHNAAGNADSIVKSQYITVYSSPNINFSGTPTTGCFPLPVQFSDASQPLSGTITSWEWDFGDGNVAGIQNPSHVYTGAGNYNVSLRVTNSFGCAKTLTKPQYIQISTGVHADFTNNTTSSCNPPVTITFQNTSTGVGVLNYQWSFGDGGTSVLQNPSHTYVSNGSFTVRLIVSNGSGCTDTITKTNLIILGNVHADFTTPANACVGNPVILTNTSAPLPSSATWNFGDGTLANTLNATKVYNTAGVYTIKMVANFGSCLDSISKPITIFSKPVASFTGAPTSSCKAPLTVNFNNTSIGGVSYNWDFGDGATSTLLNPTHTYTTTGSFNVQIIITNASGCSDTLLKTTYIVIQPPVVDILNLPHKDCAPLQHTFTPSVTSNDPVTGYLWDFGDGTTSTLANPTHTFPVGNYTISLTITTAGGCIATVTKINGIVSSAKPHANFIATPRDVCAFMPVNFTDLSTGAPDQWLWNFGDGATSTDPNPTHEYTDTGYFNVTLIIWNNGCPDSIRFDKYIHIKPPIANFLIHRDCSFKRTITFQDASIGADTWTWDFGDGTSSTLQSPLHTFTDTGTYTIKLTVKNLTTGCEHTKTQTIRIIDEKANFVASDTVICKGNYIVFNGQGINPANIVSYDWAFGDGTFVSVSTLPVSHFYAQPGQYDVRLIITDIFGCQDVLLKPLYIRVYGPTAAFTSSAPGTCLNSSMTFVDNSVTDGIHPIQQWVWNYGDGTIVTLNAPPFQHTYSTQGTFTISLKVTDSNGCVDSTTNTNSIVISKPVAAFIADTLSCSGQPLQFTDQSTGPGLNYIWDFGDGTTSTAQNPTHSYATQGTYTIKLFITDQYGCSDSTTKNNYVTISNPIANFSVSDSISTCPPLIVNFTNQSSNYTSYSWNFGDGTTSSLLNPTHFYTTSGTFNVVLTVTGFGGCTIQKTKQIIVRGPQGSFTYSPITGCNPLTVNFVGTTPDIVSFVWDFNDGTTIPSPNPIISHTYTNPGIYLPKMILVDPNGCQVPIVGLDTIKVFGVQANFTSNTTTMCDSGFISFTSLSNSNDLITGYLWNFGDGTTSTAQNPVHPYNATGSYTIQLIVTTQSGCKDTTSVNAPIKIVNSPKIGIGGDSAACIPATLNFLGQVLVADTSALSWSWTFGNGNTSTLQNPSQTYPVAGGYNIKVIATNSSGCKDSATKVVQALPLPIIVANADSILCKGQSINLSASGGASYVWSPGTFLTCTNCATPVSRPDSGISYIVQGTAANGCKNSDTVSLTVRLPFVMNVGAGDTMCIGGIANLLAGGAFAYVWSPAASLNNPLIAQPIAKPTTTTTYQVIGTDDRGCFKDTGFIKVIVYPIPVVNAGPDKTINVGQTIDLIPTVSNDVTVANWTPTSGIFRNIYPGITVKPTQTTEYTIDVSNAGGCKAQDKVTVFVVCNNANVFMPNTFSPNGDGANDVFYPRGTGIFKIRTLRVFNRWGEVVFEKANMTPNEAAEGWDGTFKGNKLNPDVFVYTIDIICENNTVLTYKGNIALIQ